MITKSLVIIGLANIVNRILVFYFFWLASYEITDLFNDRQLGFVNEKWSWEQYPITKMNIYNSTCPNNTISLINYTWPGIAGYNDSGITYQYRYKIDFQKWAISSYPTLPFLLCGVQGSTNFISYASSETTSCEQRNMTDCGQGVEFCVNKNETCPITSFNITTNLTITTNINSSSYPLSMIRVDVDNPCANTNLTNYYKSIPPDSHLFDLYIDECTDLDTSYQKVNTINDTVFFTINNALEFQKINTLNNRCILKQLIKALYFTNYPYWNKSCNGLLFKKAIQMRTVVDKLSFNSNANHVNVIVYLLLINYIIPAIPFIFRKVGIKQQLQEQLRLKNFIKVDYFFRIIFFIIFLTFSSLIIHDCDQIISDTFMIIQARCVTDLSNLYYLQEQIQTLYNLNIVALAITIGTSFIEGVLLFCLLTERIYHKAQRFFQRRKETRKLQNFQALNQSQDAAHQEVIK